MVAIPKQFEVYLVCLDPTIGSEIQKTRPCVIISPNEMNQYIKTVIIAPMTTAKRNYPLVMRHTGFFSYSPLDDVDHIPLKKAKFNPFTRRPNTESPVTKRAGIKVNSALKASEKILQLVLNII
ncbi:type II toxin-antitoxin system PemK/MazF family toxin [Moorena sp. SIO3A2]|uniref:type II toxin-antitoxin system PemK/MazF family toxin n=1 Tax=Moorena sp. SIO3A2 TaxID=2607841 RepID=UPI0025800D10|nr:type II toxin-antitoxin system PemK/MazF family toxin [Moorena sp. SIO3A2]